MVTPEQIIEAIKTTPSILTSILPTIQETDTFKTLLSNRSESVYKERIGEEIKKVHGAYDNDILTILGEKPSTTAEGTKEKTYEKNKSLLTELKKLRESKGGNDDSKVNELLNQIESLKKEGGNKFIEEQFNQSKQLWETERNDLISKLENIENTNTDFKKKTYINEALRGFNFNPDTPEPLKKLVIDNATNSLISNSKFEGDKLVFLDENGKVSMDNATYAPNNATQMLKSMGAMEAILLKETKNTGGGAAQSINGSVNNITVDGKNVKKLVLPNTTFTSKAQFYNVAEKALFDSGITKRDDNFDTLMIDSYKEFKINELPTE